LSGQNSCAVTLSGAAAGITIVPQATSDTQSNVLNAAATWNTAASVNAGSISYAGSAANYTGNVGANGITAFRINVTAYTSGSPTYTLTCSPTLAGITTTPSGTQVVSGTVTANQGTPAAAANAWPVQETFSGANIDPRIISFVSAQPVTGTFFQATQPVSCASGATCPVNATLQGTSAVSLATLPALVAGAAVIGKVGIDQTTPGTTNLVAAGQNGTWTVQPGNTQNTTPWLVAGGLTRTVLTSSSTTACTAISATATRLWSITNSGPATTIFPAFYNDTGTTCASATAVFGDATTITLGPGQVINFTGGLPLAGAAYKLSGALTAGQNLIVITGPQ